MIDKIVPKNAIALPEYLRKVRQRKCIKQKDIAAKIGITTQCLCNWEKARDFPSYIGLIKWFDALGVRVI